MEEILKGKLVNHSGIWQVEYEYYYYADNRHELIKEYYQLHLIK